MTVKILMIRHFGDLPFYMQALRGGLNLIGHSRPHLIATALRLLLCDQTLPCPAHLLEEGTQLDAIVETKERTYCVRATPAEGKGRLALRAWDEKGTDRTPDYLRECEHTEEQDFTDVFDRESACAHPRFLQYEREAEFFTPGALPARTRGISRTARFRTHLCAHIKAFARGQICEGKEYELIKEAGGHALRLHAEKKKVAALSATEEIILRYLCFLYTARFWQEFDLERNLHALKKPLIITDLIEQLDKETDMTDLFEKTKGLARQSILLTTPAALQATLS